MTTDRNACGDAQKLQLGNKFMRQNLRGAEQILRPGDIDYA